MKVYIQNNQKDLKIKALQVRHLVKEALCFENSKSNAVSVYFVTESAISKLHKDYFDDPSITDCISFPMDDESEEDASPLRVLGEVFVCPSVAIKYAKENKGCAYQEVTLYIVHGLLHLLGYDDIETNDRKIMRMKEKKLMAHLKKRNLILQV